MAVLPGLYVPGGAPETLGAGQGEAPKGPGARQNVGNASKKPSVRDMPKTVLRAKVSVWGELDNYLAHHPYIHLSLTCYRQSGGIRVWSATLFKESNNAVVGRGMNVSRDAALESMMGSIQAWAAVKAEKP